LQMAYRALDSGSSTPNFMDALRQRRMLQQNEQNGGGINYATAATPMGGQNPQTFAPPAPAQYTPASTNADISGLHSPITQEIGRVRSDAPQAYQSFINDRTAGRNAIMPGLLESVNAGMSASMPSIANNLNQYGIVESGAYPEALAKRQQELVAQQILPTMSQYDVNTYNIASQIPLDALANEQALRAGSVGRGFSEQDSASAYANQKALADKYGQNQLTSGLVNLLPSIIGAGGVGGLFGGGNQQNGSAGGILGGILGGGGSGSGGGGIGLPSIGGVGGAGSAGGGIGNWLENKAYGGSGFEGALGSGVGGMGGYELARAMGGSDAMQGMGGALGSFLGGGGLTGALGGGLGAAFGDRLGLNGTQASALLGGLGGAFGGDTLMNLGGQGLGWLSGLFANNYNPLGDLTNTSVPVDLSGISGLMPGGLNGLTPSMNEFNLFGPSIGGLNF